MVLELGEAIPCTMQWLCQRVDFLLPPVLLLLGKISDVKPGCLPYLSPPQEDRKMMMMMIILLNKIFGYLVTTPPHDRNRFNISGGKYQGCET